MTAWGQLGEFCFCAVFGLLLGAAVHAFGLNKGGFSAVIECGICLLFACVFVWLGVAVGLSGKRGYHYLGILIGIIIYSKTFRIIVAFFKKVCYNIIKKLVKFPWRKKKSSVKKRRKEI